MLIAGAQRHAKEVVDIFEKNNLLSELVLFDDVSADCEAKLFGKYTIIRTLEEVKKYFLNINPAFVLGLGNPILREKVALKLKNQMGILTSIVSKSATIGAHNVLLEDGLNIMHNTLISNDVFIGEGSLINAYVCVHHDVRVGKYSELSPKSVLLGGAVIGSFTSIGANATVLPGIKIGSNVTIGAGSVVTKDVPDNCIAVGVPARIIKIKSNIIY
jgi:sugar O-acyltransferase (sialic acid O-acetyltransferase NeuD family)